MLRNQLCVDGGLTLFMPPTSAAQTFMSSESSFVKLLNLMEMNHQLACDPDDGGCGKLNYNHHILSKFMLAAPTKNDEEVDLVDHINGMSLTTGAKHELKSLLVSLLMLGEVDIARKLQRIVENFQLSQMAAVKLCDDATSSNIIGELAYSLDHYTQKLREEARLR